MRHFLRCCQRRCRQNTLAERSTGSSSVTCRCGMVQVSPFRTKNVVESHLVKWTE